jgi:hypothetical protein
MVDIKTPD